LEERMLEYKKKRGIASKRLVGAGWYSGFMRRYGRRAKSHNKDSKQHTWCTCEIFSNMHDSIYPQMVEAGVVINGMKK
jgi:hypothetical protein